MNHEVKSEKLLKRVKPYEVDFLYKYHRVNSRGLERAIAHNEIYLPDPSIFNDPFDCRPLITIHKSELKRREFYKSIIKSRFPNATGKELKLKLKNPRFKNLKNREYLEELLKDFIKDFGIYCLTEVADDILMWSHYSNSHTGVCLQFNAIMDNTIFWEAYKVNYQEDYPIVNIMDLKEFDQFFNLFATKSTHWEYEKERRVIKTPHEGGPKKYTFNPELLTGVILGARIKPEDEELIIEWVRNRKNHTNIYRAEIDNKSYRINIKGINC